MDAFDNNYPGPAKSQTDKDEKGFSKIEVLLEATGGLSLSQVCVVTGLEASTIQNWVKRGWVAHPIGKRYEEIHIARILIINALKECIKLEHIAVLMTYLNGRAKDGSEAIIKESVLYNYLCDAMKKSGQMGDGAKGGVESVVETVIKDYKNPDPASRTKLRKTLTLMMYACVCTDVKRRTEAMMGQIIKELDDLPPLPSKPAQTKSASTRTRLTIDPSPAITPAPAAAASIPAPVPVTASAPAVQAPAAVMPQAAPVMQAPVQTSPVQATPAVQPIPDISPLQAPAQPPIQPIQPISAVPPVQAAVNTAPRPATVQPPVTPIRITLDDPELPDEELDEAARTRKTISQALREWDISSVEKIIIDHDEETQNENIPEADTKKPANRPWYIRKNKQ